MHTGHSGHSRVSVLIVEDDEDSRMVLRELLDEEGYTVADVTAVDTALDYLREARDCVVLLDYLLPRETGAVLLRAVEREVALRRHRYVFATAAEMRRIPVEDRQLAERLCSAILLKPFEMDTLLQAVRNAELQPSRIPQQS